MQRVLVISADERGIVGVRSELAAANFQVEDSGPDEEALETALSNQNPELIILDLRPPGSDLRKMKHRLTNVFNLHDVPIIGIMNPTWLHALDFMQGIDDFVVHPFRPEELTARIRLMFWRYSQVDSDQILRVGELVVDMANYRVSLENNTLELTFKEFELLKFLVTHRGKVFTRDSLLSRVWGYDYFGGARTVDVHIRRLRAKLGFKHEALIETVRNVGYKFTG